MTATFTRVSYRDPTDQPGWCDFAICRRASGATVLLEDCPDNLGTIGGQYVESLATILWQNGLHDLDAGEIRWFHLSKKELRQIRFSLVPANRGGFFGMPRWELLGLANEAGPAAGAR
jgi:hypothetical protein